MISRVKICGITRAEDALTSIEAGASALGFVFYAPSPRYICPEKAQLIIASLPPFVTTTALFVNESPQIVQAIIDLIQPDLLQFHGDEDAVYCQQFNRPFIKALRVKADTNLLRSATAFVSARALLLDAYVKGVPGGTGANFNWDIIPLQMRSKIILAGGLDADNVAAAIAHVRPYAVDVSGGLEAQKGIKCPVKTQQFMRAVNSANSI